ncbi:MAG: cytochrome c peroxidase [Catalinimonas sp.]
MCIARASLFPLLIILLAACGKKDDALPDATSATLDLPAYFPRQTFEDPDNPLTEEGIDLGRHLFFDRRLSSDGRVSCASCHRPEFAFSDPAPRSRGVRGQLSNRHSMSLANLLWVNRLFWDGRASTLEDQALHPIVDPLEMDMTLDELTARLQALPEYPPQFEAAFGSEQVTADGVARALAQFERTMISSNAKYDRYERGEAQLTAQELRGLALFQTHPEPSISLRGGNCGDCHLGVTFGGSNQAFDGFFNNGVQGELDNGDIGLESVTGDPNDRGKFRTPSLRNVALTAPYMHNGSLQTLEEVLDHYNHPALFDRPNVDIQILQGSNDPTSSPTRPSSFGLMLTDREKADIIAFLYTLTDSSFISNPAFRNPFGP